MKHLDEANSYRNTNSTNYCPSNYPPNHYYHHQHNANSNYLNCAAPKSVLTHNCQMIRQIQRDYPPYPTDVGVYYHPNNALSHSPHSTHPYYAAQYPMQSTPPQCSSPQHGAMPLHLRPNGSDAKTKGPKHPGILKNYKSCPVSPVHEEIDWSSTAVTTTTPQMIGADSASPFDQNRQHMHADLRHRHSMYNDGKSLLDMIHTNTEKMIAEITQKYGDINIDTPSMPHSNRNSGNNNDENANDDEALHDNDGNDDDGSMSSDSLEDCSLDLDCVGRCESNSVRRRKTVCKKKHRKNEPISMMPTRSVSEYFIYDEFYLNRNRNVSLSDILNDDADKPKPDYAFLNSQRHSSASFFLAPERKSQESLISDDMSGCGGVSYCNSMESILSDESECKSAPLEALFTKTKRDILTRTSNIMCEGRFDAQTMTSSKSYGSSPNSNVFDYFMDQQYRAAAGAAYGFADRDACNIANYDYDSLVMSANTSARTSNRCSPLPHNFNLPPPPPEFQNITAKPLIGIPISCTFPSMSGLTYQARNNEDFIPRFASKNDQYSSQTNKSLSKEFAVERQIRNSNPLYTAASPTATTPGDGDDDSDLFQRKPIKPAIPAKPSKLMDIAFKPIPSTSAAAKAIDESKVIPAAGLPSNNIKRSCSFEIEMFHNRGRVLQQKSAAKKYEQNLQKFEKEHRHRMRNANSQFGGTMEMPYVPHKPPVANRRSASMKSKKGAKLTAKDHEKPIESKSLNSPNRKMSIEKKRIESAKKELEYDDAKEADEKTIEMFIAETACDDDNMDSLDLYTKPKLYKENSVDSLDGTPVRNRPRPSASFTSDDQLNDTAKSTEVSLDFLSKSDATKFRDIEKKIDVINKLVELEEKKLEQERSAKELRMRPFTCNPKEKGYVRSLTLNFDNLAKSIKYERELSLRLKEQNEIRRNHSLPDVLEDTKYRFKCGFNQRRQRSTDTYLDGYGRIDGVRLKQQFIYQSTIIFWLCLIEFSLHLLFTFGLDSLSHMT